MKKIVFLCICLISVFIFLPKVNALGNANDLYVYYITESNNYLKKIPDDIKQYATGKVGHIYALADQKSNDILENMKKSMVFVAVGHGAPGMMQFKDNTYLVGIGKTSYNVRAVSSLTPPSLSGLKMAIYYGCKTGDPSSSYGDIVLQTIRGGARTAVGWKVDLTFYDTVEWNRLFFEKGTIHSVVESYRHADYWLRRNHGDAAADTFQYNRNEKGDIERKLYY